MITFSISAFALDGSFQNIILSILANFGVAMSKSAASAASPNGVQAEKLNFQAVIKSDASAACPTAWGAPGRRLGMHMASGGLGQAVGEAALAADFTTA